MYKKLNRWEDNYKRLLEFYKENGHTNVPRNPVNKKFYRWVHTQGLLYNKGALTKVRAKKLNKISFIANLKENIWEQSLKKLRKYKEEYGDCYVRKGYHKSVYCWALAQRLHGKRGELNQDRIAKLDSIGFIWDLSTYKWNIHYNNLIEFYTGFKHFKILENERYGGLYRWLYNLKKAYKNGKLPKEQIQLIENICYRFENTFNRKRINT